MNKISLCILLFSCLYLETSFARERNQNQTILIKRRSTPEEENERDKALVSGFRNIGAYWTTLCIKTVCGALTLAGCWASYTAPDSRNFLVSATAALALTTYVNHRLSLFFLRRSRRKFVFACEPEELFISAH